MNKIYKIIMIGLLNSIGISTCAQYYFPTLSQWQSFDSVALQLPEGFHKKIANKKKIKESMEASPKIAAIKLGVMAAVNGYGNLFSTPEQKKMMMEKDHIDGWSASPRLSEVDANSLLVKIIEAGDTVSLAAFLEMTQGSSFDINKCFFWVVGNRQSRNSNTYGYRTDYTQYSPLKLAIAKNQPGIAEMLIAHGAQISQSLVKQAVSQRNKELAEMLIVRAARLGQANIAIGAIASGAQTADGIIVPVPPLEVNDEYVEPSRLAQLSQMRQQNQEAVLVNRRAIQNRSSSGWYVIFLMLLFLPNLCLSFIGKEHVKNIVSCSTR